VGPLPTCTNDVVVKPPLLPTTGTPTGMEGKRYRQDRTLEAAEVLGAEEEDPRAHIYSAKKIRHRVFIDH
jgi:hypothetical protein